MGNKTDILIRKGQHKKISKATWIFCFEILLLILICVIHSLGAGYYADFYPINGTFQNFNPVRRL